MSCPYCNGTDCELVEIDEKYQKIECFECGLSSPMVPQNGQVSDQKAYELWDNISFEKDKLMEALAKADPWRGPNNDYRCDHCEERFEDAKQRVGVTEKVNAINWHKPDCIWLKAWLYVQEKEGKK